MCEGKALTLITHGHFVLNMINAFSCANSQDYLLSDIEEIEIVAVAENAYEGIKMCSPDLAIFDIRMPGTSGIDLLWIDFRFGT